MFRHRTCEGTRSVPVVQIRRVQIQPTDQGGAELGLREAGAALFGVWRWQWPTVAVVLAPIMTVDLAQFGANALKIPTGGSR